MVRRAMQQRQDVFNIFFAVSSLLSMKLAHGIQWIKGSDGLSCTSICAESGGCTEFWPRSESEFLQFLRQAQLDEHCQTFRRGEVRYDPSTDGKDCGWMVDMPRKNRCDIIAPNGVYRFCPCGNPPDFRPTPPPGAGDGETVEDDDGYIEPEDSPTPAMPGLPERTSAPTPAPVPTTSPPMTTEGPAVAVTSCPLGVITCDNGITLARDPKLNCAYPTCPDEAWPVYCAYCAEMDTCKDHCSGEEIQSLPCPNQPVCPDDRTSFHSCEPSDCQWAQWSDWETEGCTGLCNRTRTFMNSACGGNPCGGRVHETKVCDSPCNPIRDCVFGDWQQWSSCDSDNFRQRTRIIDVPESGGGNPCQGPLGELRSCADEVKGPVDCEISDWFEWSGCTTTCGGGQTRRVRSILKWAENDGAKCPNCSLEEIAPCSQNACPAVAADEEVLDCYLGDWELWSPCRKATKTRIRLRSVAEGNQNGEPCNGTVEEAEPCVGANAESDCEVGPWTSWTLCSKTCDAGQTYRSRNLVAEAKGGDACTEVLMQTKPCHDHPCSVKNDFTEGSCHLSKWTQWSGCSEHCGQGVERRTRSVLQEAFPGGKGCDGNLEEVRGCQGDTPECSTKDCLWMLWTDWSKCSATCGGGNHKRFRNVKAPPMEDGKMCSPHESIQQIKPCNTQKCPSGCVDAVWGQWTPWGHCSRTCGKGFEWRSRVVEREATICGKEAVGDIVQERPCRISTCEGDKDCLFGEWSQWTSCSATCWGFTQRERPIVEQSEGDGAPCGDGLRETKSCNSPEDVTDISIRKACSFGIKVDCEFGSWGSWSECSKSCGGGVHNRSRAIVKPASFGGNACFNNLQEIDRCQAQPCNPDAQDCLWDDWGDWSICSKCDGERHRKRKISQLPIGDVAECEDGVAQEVSMCARECGDQLYYCIWEDWSTGACDRSCGRGSLPWTRSLMVTPLYPSESWRMVGKLHDKGEQCEGTEVKYEECSNLPLCGECVPQDCAFGAWSQWTAPTCNGVCSRKRSIVRHNNECGKPCAGPAAETMACHADNCGGRDCEVGFWTEWDVAKCTHTGAGQKTRSRKVTSLPARGGAACNADLSETIPCSEGIETSVDCRVSPWLDWTECDRTCGNGQRTRERKVTPAQNGGSACGAEGVDLQVRITESCSGTPCNTLPDSDCILSKWSEWTGCGMSANAQAYRERVIAAPANGKGTPCNGGLRETGQCPKLPPRDCELSDWHDWGNCDASCGGGSKFRTREVVRPARNGGKPCNMETLHENIDCGEEPCPTTTDCIVSPWHSWSGCDATCGQGLLTRFRNITQPAQPDAEGCNLKMVEVLSCKAGECPNEKDCKLSEWGSWGECQKAVGCGTGYRSRSRQVQQEASSGGHPCDLLPLHEVRDSAKCPGHCHEGCVDGHWEQWSTWSTCSVSCGLGGEMKRTRKAWDASACGTPVEGLAVEFVQCVAPACPAQSDCSWMSWSQWEACSASCNGQKLRKRGIQNHAQNGGRACEGPTVEASRCNPSAGEESVPLGCPEQGVPKDCKLADWQDWSSCTEPCEGGYQKRVRIVLQAPAHGGLSCDGHLQEIGSCNTQRCTNFRDCAWTDWEDWSGCDPTAKEKTRHRQIARAANHGLDCTGPDSEVRACFTGCEDTLHYCVWSEWSSWSSCSSSCGDDGRITRSRKMTADSDGNAPRVEVNSLRQLREFSTLGRGDMEGLPGERVQELVIAFMSGLLSLAAALSLQHCVVRRPQAASGVPMSVSEKPVRAWGLPQ